MTMALRALFLLGSLLTSPAFAEQLDAISLQRVITVVQNQRNIALDSAAAAEVRTMQLSEELAKAQVRIKELEPKPEKKE